MTYTVALDAVGGDHAPDVVVEGAIAALAESDEPVHVLLFGPEDVVRESMAKHDAPSDGITAVHAPDVIEMSESPSSAVKSKQNSSIHLGLGAVKAGKAHAFASAGNTGAVMAASLFILGRLPNISRPTIMGLYPTLKGGCVLLDVGANVDCKPEHLVQFAQMGTVYATHILGRDNPTVGLMNIGEEPGKGNDQSKKTYAELSDAAHINFVGNIEGRDLLQHGADVVVCDGFVGNILLKLGESIAHVIPQLIGKEMQRQQLDEDTMRKVGGILKGVQKPFDYQEYGGTPLLGVDGVALIGHGGSTAKAIKNMIFSAVKAAKQELPQAISSLSQ